MADSSDPRFERAKAEFLLGLEAHGTGRFADAERHYLASLSVMPGRASTLINLAATQLRLQKPAPALRHADEALAIEPGSADALLHRAIALQQLGRPDDALHAFRRLLVAAPDNAPAWSGIGTLLREMSRLDEAAHAFRQALAHGADPELHNFYLASVDGRQAPSASPVGYVRTLFDDYADDFDAHLVGELKYDAHRQLIDGLLALAPGPYRSALDLGCGTGLCGPLLRPHAQRLTGIDLSPRMLEKARALGVYDRLECADVAEHLRTTDETHDLIAAADVFIYVGELEAVFAQARRVMTRGIFCFSVELVDDADADADLRLLPSLRYAHSEAYLRRLAARHRFDIAAVRQKMVRQDQTKPVRGLYVYLGVR